MPILAVLASLGLAVASTEASTAPRRIAPAPASHGGHSANAPHHGAHKGSTQRKRAAPAASGAVVAAPSTRQLARMSAAELAQWVPGHITTVIVPVGGTEPRGSVPSGADTIAPETIADEIAPRVQALVAPAIPYGLSRSGGSAAALTVPEDAYLAYVRAVLVGLARAGFRNAVLLNGRLGPQAAALQSVAEAAQKEAGINARVLSWSKECEAVAREVFGADAASTDTESALLFAIDPALLYVPPSTAAGGSGSAPHVDVSRAALYYSRVLDTVARRVSATAAH